MYPSRHGTGRKKRRLGKKNDFNALIPRNVITGSQSEFLFLMHAHGYINTRATKLYGVNLFISNRCPSSNKLGQMRRGHKITSC